MPILAADLKSFFTGFFVFTFILFLLFFLLVLSFHFSLRNTVFEFSLKRASFSGLVIAKEVYVFVVLGVFLFEMFGVDSFHTFYMTDESARVTSVFIFYSLIFLFIFIGVFCKTLFRDSLINDRLGGASDYRWASCFNFSIIIVLCALTVFFYFFGVKHAFISSFLSGESLISVRMSSRYSGLPTVFMSYYSFLTYVLAIFVGYYGRSLDKIPFFLLIAFLLFCGSYFGSKAPVVNVLVFIVLSWLSANRRIKIKLSLVAKIFAGLLAFFIFLFYVVRVQFPDIDLQSFFFYLVGRVGVGQIHGVYEQFALQLRDDSYVFHTVPFANFFLDYKIYNKDLMMKTWGAFSSADEVGVMNSLFIGEALAIGGYWLVVFSPVIVAFNYCLLAASIIMVFNRFFGLPLHDSRKVGGLVVVGFVAFTGDITGLLLFKSLFMLMIFLLSIFFVFRILRYALFMSV